MSDQPDNYRTLPRHVLGAKRAVWEHIAASAIDSEDGWAYFRVKDLPAALAVDGERIHPQTASRALSALADEELIEYHPGHRGAASRARLVPTRKARGDA